MEGDAPTAPASAPAPPAAVPPAPAPQAPVVQPSAPEPVAPRNPYAARPAPKRDAVKPVPSRAEKLALAKAQARIAELEPLANKAKAGVAALATFATTALAELTPEQQSAVKDRAGDDPTAQLETIAWMRKHKMLSAPTAPVHAAPGATTGPASGTAPLAAPVVDADVANFQRWREMKAKGAHLAAGQFREFNRASIEAGAKKAEAKLAAS